MGNDAAFSDTQNQMDFGSTMQSNTAFKTITSPQEGNAQMYATI